MIVNTHNEFFFVLESYFWHKVVQVFSAHNLFLWVSYILIVANGILSSSNELADQYLSTERQFVLVFITSAPTAQPNCSFLAGL